MVKERKHQMGATNLSARAETTGPPPGTGQKPGILYATNSSFVRTWSHQLIAPEMYKPPDTGPKGDRRMKVTATWKPGEVANRDFTTTHKGTYRDPRTIQMKEHHDVELSSEDIAALNAAKRERENAVTTICQVVKNTHGTVGSLLRSVSNSPSYLSLLYI